MNESTAKARVDEGEVLAFLQRRMSPRVERVSLVAGGEVSQAFSFSLSSDEFIVRINRDDFPFRKDDFAARRFATKALPIPAVLHLDAMNPECFACITPRARGTMLNLLPAGVRDNIMPQVMAMLDAIHMSNVTHSGYGIFDASGHAPHHSWQAAMLTEAIGNEPHWHSLFGDTCMEPTVHRALSSQVISLSVNLPDMRQLVHGDVGMDNTIAHAGGITAVIDWSGAMYGDPLFDVAWLHVWWKEVPFARLYREHATRTAIDLTDYEMRLRCYASCFGLNALGFFADSNQPDKYQWLKARLAAIGIL